MHISLLPLSSPPEARVRKALLEADLAWLREELSGAKSPEQKASIAYQIGLLEHVAGRDSSAVRQLLAAVNTVAHFKEPLERLIVLIERHRSFKNLPTLLEHLCRTAEGNEEIARARLASGWCALLHGRDEARALPHVQQALSAAPRDPAVLATLELLARRRNDDHGLRVALAAQLEIASDPTWAALIGIELAERLAAIGDHEQAADLLGVAAARPTPVAFVALQQRFALGRVAGRTDWAIDSLASRADRIIAALDSGEASTEASERVPPGVRGRSSALDTLLMQAELERSAGRDAAALVTLERAARLDPEHPLVLRALIDQARRVGRHALAESAIQAELAFDPTAAEATSLWLELAEAHAARERGEAAIAALRQALELDPRCWFAHARRLEELRARGDAEAAARSLAHIAEHLADGAARGRYWLLAADALARHARSPAEASEALEHAVGSGVPVALVRRVERALAHASEDRAAYQTATLRLLETDLDDAERVGLELECWRRALLAGDEAAIEARLDRLEASVAGARVARLCRAYAPSVPGQPGGSERGRGALARLAELEPHPTRAAAIAWGVGLRLDGEGERQAAIEALARVHASQPRHAAVAGTLSGWLHESDPVRAAAVLRTTARTLQDEAFAASLLIQAGLVCWWAGERETARQDFEAAERPSKNGRAGALSAWARRASAGSGSGTEAGPSDPEERLLGALDRATRAGAGLRELGELGSALRGAGDGCPDDLVSLARLTSLVSSRALGVKVDPIELDRTAGTSPAFARLVESFRYLEQIGQAEPSPRSLEEITRRWSDGEGGLVATLEWLAASARSGQRRNEQAARLRVSERLSGRAAEQVRASAAIAMHLSQLEPAEYLEGHSPELVLANLETSPPGCDPRRRARALEGIGDLLGSDSEPILGLLRGYNQLATGDVDAAIGSFRRYTDAYPDDPSGWEGLLGAARRGDDPALLAEAAARLGSTSRDPAHAARLFEEASEIFFDRLGDEVAGQAALARAVQLDPSRSSSFARLFGSLRDTASAEELLVLIERRLPFAAGPDELVELSWQRARAQRKRGDLDAALEALATLAGHEPNHLGALTLSAEIFIATQRYDEAVERLVQLAESEAAPRDQRLSSGLMAIDLCDHRLGDTPRALAIASQLERADLANCEVRERLARAAAKSGAWHEAARLFEGLMHERATPEERAEAARLALVIHRDERHDPRAAGAAAKVLLELVPGDAEALDLALSGALEPELARELLSNGRSALARAISLAPTDVDKLERLARIAEQLGDVRLRQSSIGALVALGHEQQASRAELVSLERRISTLPPQPVPNDVLAELADPDDRGPVPDLLALVAPYLAEAFGPPRHAFALNRRERISERSGEPLRDEIAAWVNAFGLGEFDLYLSPVPSERLVVLGTQPLTVIAGASVSVPLGPFQRLALARSLYAARRGLSPLIVLEESDVIALIAALCSVAGVELNGPRPVRQRDFERQLLELLPRKTRKQLHEQARPVRDAQASLAIWVRAASMSLDRAAAVAVGDASVILADAPARELASAAQEERARRLLGFMLSPEFEAMRQRFGVTVR
jgi:tetratricopeptide (TPR) repeat protein